MSIRLDHLTTDPIGERELRQLMAVTVPYRRTLLQKWRIHRAERFRPTHTERRKIIARVRNIVQSHALAGVAMDARKIAKEVQQSEEVGSLIVTAYWILRIVMLVIQFRERRSHD